MNRGYHAYFLWLPYPFHFQNVQKSKSNVFTITTSVQMLLVHLRKEKQHHGRLAPKPQWAFKVTSPTKTPTRVQCHFHSKALLLDACAFEIKPLEVVDENRRGVGGAHEVHNFGPSKRKTICMISNCLTLKRWKSSDLPNSRVFMLTRNQPDGQEICGN